MSAKLNFIVDEVQSSHPEDAFIVFSESKLTLACVAQAMEICNISCVHNGDGKKPSPAQLRGFKASGGSKVLLLEPKHGGRGLHLTRANRIIFASPCWNKDDEAQATLRSHRIGQRRKVTVQLLVMENSFEAALLRRRNQLNDVQQEGAKVQHYRNEADDDQLRWRLEHAAFIEPTPGEEHLHSFNLWKQACKLIPQEARQNPSGSPDAKRTSEPPKKKRKTKSSSSATKVSPEDTDLASAASTSTYTVPPLLPSRNASAPGRSALKRKIDSASDHADDDNGPCMRKRARVGVAKAVHFSV